MAVPIEELRRTYITTAPESVIEVQVPLKPGKYVFQLVVVDDARNESPPATVEVIIRPKAIITAEPDHPEHGMPFKLSGEKSVNAKEYRWTLTEEPPSR